MASGRGGIILESYARTAGTGNVPVPGVVTSRRTTSRQERLKRQLQVEEEDERSRKQRKEQEAVAKLLAQKWAEEDRRSSKKKRKKDTGGSGSENDERRSSARRSGGRSKEERGDAAEEEAEGDEDEDDKEEDPGGWVSVTRPPMRLGALERKVEQEPAPKDPPARQGAWRVSEPAPSTSAASSSTGAQKTAPIRARLKKVPGFGFGVSDSEDDEEKKMKKELERAGRKTSKMTTALPEERPTSGRPAADLCSQLMKMAEWKRKCGGKRVPMPEEMKQSVARAMSGSL